MQREWTPRRAYDLRLDSVAKAAALAVKACGSHVDATERFIRRFMDHLDSASEVSDPGSSSPRRGSSRAA